MELSLPNDKELEKIVLGTIISNKHEYDEVRDIISEDCFYDDFHLRVFRIFKQIEASGDEPNAISIVQEYKKKYNEIKYLEISYLCDFRSLMHTYYNTCRLNDLSARRKLIELGYYLQNKAVNEQEEIADISDHANDLLSKLYSTSDNSVSTMEDAIKGVYRIMESNLSSQSAVTGSPTGFHEFDKRSGGFQGSDLIIIGGESSNGKTSLILSMIKNISSYGHGVGMYSLEMGKEQLAARLIAMESGISSSKILFTPLDRIQFDRIDKSVQKLFNSNIYFDDRSTSNIDTIINSIRKLKIKYDIKGAVVDYMQILNVNMRSANEEQQLANIARRFKNLAKDLDIWIVALSQLNKDASNPVPNRNRLRGSGQIFEAADIVMYSYLPYKYNRDFPEPFSGKNYETKGYAFIDVDKGRNIGTFKFLAGFQEDITLFYEVSQINIPTKQELSNDNDEPF